MTPDKIVAEFDKRFVTALSTEYKTRIREWIKDTLTQDRLAISNALVEALEGKKLGGHRDESKRIYAGGYDDALTEAQNIITQLLESKN